MTPSPWLTFSFRERVNGSGSDAAAVRGFPGPLEEMMDDWLQSLERWRIFFQGDVQWGVTIHHEASIKNRGFYGVLWEFPW